MTKAVEEFGLDRQLRGQQLLGAAVHARGAIVVVAVVAATAAVVVVVVGDSVRDCVRIECEDHGTLWVGRSIVGGGHGDKDYVCVFVNVFPSQVYISVLRVAIVLVGQVQVHCQEAEKST